MRAHSPAHGDWLRGEHVTRWVGPRTFAEATGEQQFCLSGESAELMGCMSGIAKTFCMERACQRVRLTGRKAEQKWGELGS